jgi:hypothetical protein
MEEAKWKGLWYTQVQSITPKSNIKSDLMVQIFCSTGEDKRKEKSGEEIKVNMLQQAKLLNFKTNTFKQKAVKKSCSTHDQNLS